MRTPLNASASTAGALFSGSTFEIPQFQREYSWGDDEVADFWSDLQTNLESSTYFLGLVILTEDGERKHVVDGQQRLIAMSLLADAIYRESLSRGRSALADRIQADFLQSIDYDSDVISPRIKLSDNSDDATFQFILNSGDTPKIEDFESVSYRIARSYKYIRKKLVEDIENEQFKRLGKWADFITHKIYFAVFLHPDASSAYQVFEVINTRGKELTTADLLKNFILSKTPARRKEARYREWQSMARHFSDDGANNFVQFIRHAVTVEVGHILPKDLFGFLAGRLNYSGKVPPSPDGLTKILESRLPLYAQMIDPTLGGPAEQHQLDVFASLNSLGVIAVRPILLAISDAVEPLEGMRSILRLVVRRIVVGNLGTGNVERRFGEAAKKIRETGRWEEAVDELADLNPGHDDFVNQLRKRSFNKRVLGFIRRSVLQNTITPETHGTLHFIWSRQATGWGSLEEEEGAYWASTIGNTFLSELERRPKGIDDWRSFKEKMFPEAVCGEWVARLDGVQNWDSNSVQAIGVEFAEAAGNVWY